MFRVTCPHCSQNIEAGDEWAGREVDCPGCAMKFIIPNFAATPAPVEKKSKVSRRAFAIVAAVLTALITAGGYWYHEREGKKEKERIAKIEFEKGLKRLDQIGDEAHRSTLQMNAEILSRLAMRVLKATHFNRHDGTGWLSSSGGEALANAKEELQERRRVILALSASPPEMQEARDLLGEMLITLERILRYYTENREIGTYSVSRYGTIKLSEDFEKLMEDKSRIELKSTR